MSESRVGTGGDELARAERLGHRWEALAPLPTAAPIQRVIYKDDKNLDKKAPYKLISMTKKYKDLDQTGRAWFHKYHNDPNDHLTVDQVLKRIKKHKQSGDQPPPISTKTKNPKPTLPFVPRQTSGFVGSQVDYSKNPYFRTERRIIRRLRKAGKSVGDKNIYTKRYKFNGKGIKLVTSSVPPGKLPNDYEKRTLENLVSSRLGQSSHSEGITNKIETHVPLFQEMAPHEHYSASSREQCEHCRYHFPPLNPKSHKFGTFYSGTTDHIKDEELRNKLIKNKGVIGKLKLTNKEREEFSQGKSSATTARQESDDQNPLLTRQRNEISSEDSEGEHSSDDDDLYVAHDLEWPNPVGWGKSKKKVNVVPRRSYFTEEEIEEVEKGTKKLIEEKKENKKGNAPKKGKRKKKATEKK